MNPTVLIGIDGATFTILDHLIAEGYMPTLKALQAGGVRGGLLSTPHPLTPPAWTTLMTGRSPGNHGIYDFLRSEVREGGAFFTLNNFRDIHCETIWSIISRQGGRVLSLGYPLMAPPPPVTGAIVPGLLSWRHLRRNVHPPGLYDELMALPGLSPKELSWDFEKEKAIRFMPEEEFASWVQQHTVRDRHWFAILRHLMDKQSYDLIAVMFDGTDKLQHGCWRVLDPECSPKEPNEAERDIRESCLEYFSHLDGLIARISQMAGPEARVFIASDHGFGPTERFFRVNKWLERQGYLAWKSPGKKRKPSENLYVDLDWERTVAFAPSMATNGIHIRVKDGTNRTGVTPDEYESFRARLMSELREIRDPIKGVPFIQDILLREEVFPGVHQGKAPDLTLVLYDYGLIATSDEEPIIEARDKIAGMHRPEGVFYGCGPGLSKGRVIEQQSIIDVAPTLLYSLGLPIPADFEGQIIASAFEPCYLADNPVEIGSPSVPPATYVSSRAAPEIEAEAEDSIVDRLRALGYVE
jgi:predicted AlkP superfamily phosphohydrolase/phosphomutase